MSGVVHTAPGDESCCPERVIAPNMTPITKHFFMPSRCRLWAQAAVQIENPALRDMLAVQYLGGAGVRKSAHHRLGSGHGSRITTAVSADRSAA